MGDTKNKVLEDAREIVAKLAIRVAHQSMVALDRTDNEVRQAMDLDAKQAPLWAHMLKSMSASMVKAQLTDAPVTNKSLSITVIGKAENTQEWLDMAKPFQKQVEAMKEAEVTVLEKKKVKAEKK